MSGASPSALPLRCLRAEIFQPEDLLLIEPSVRQLLDIPRDQRLDYGHRFAAGGSAFTLWRTGPEPVVLACCGALRMHRQYAQLWALFSRHLPRVPVAMTRIVQRYVAGLTEARIDAQVAASDGGACGWARLIGLAEETRLPGAMPDGGDMVIFRRADQLKGIA